MAHRPTCAMPNFASQRQIPPCVHRAAACFNRFQAIAALLSQNQTIIPILLQIVQNRPQNRNKTQNNNNSINASFLTKKRFPPGVRPSVLSSVCELYFVLPTR